VLVLVVVAGVLVTGLELDAAGAGVADAEGVVPAEAAGTAGPAGLV
jgi:hypothetical protein